MSLLGEKIRLRLPALVLLVVTLVFWGFYDRYESVGPLLVDSPTLVDATSVRGPVSETNSLFHLTVVEGEKKPEVRFVFPNAASYEFVRVEGRIRTKDVVRGKYAWNSARLIVIQRDAKRKWVPCHHGLLYEEGTSEWSFQRNEFEIEDATVTAEVVLQVTGTAGEAWFDSIVAYPVRVKKSLSWFRGLFAMAWIAIGVLYFKRCRLDHRKLRVLILLNALAIILGAMMPSVWIEDSSQYVQKRVVALFEKNKEPSKPVRSNAKSAGPSSKEQPGSKPIKSEIKSRQESKLLDQFNFAVGGAHKAGHFLLFASLCFLVYLSAALEHQNKGYFLKVALDLFLYAAVTESLQHLTLDRSAGFSDWLVDVYGMMTAFGLFLVILLLAKLMRVSAFDLGSSGS